MAGLLVMHVAAGWGSVLFPGAMVLEPRDVNIAGASRSGDGRCRHCPCVPPLPAVGMAIGKGESSFAKVVPGGELIQFVAPCVLRIVPGHAYQECSVIDPVGCLVNEDESIGRGKPGGLKFALLLELNIARRIGG